MANLSVLILLLAWQPTPVLLFDPNPSMSGFHFCRSNVMAFQQAKSNTTASTAKKNVTIPILYQCGGVAYDTFAVQMENYTLQQYATSRNTSMWGRREFLLPHNTTVLAIGNSHLRQTMHALCCSYASTIVNVRVFDFPDVPIYEFRFVNGASLVLSANSPLVYSRQWHKNLRKYDPLHRSLNSYNAIVLGMFNTYAVNDTTSAAQKMRAIQDKYPTEVKYTTVPPPTLADVLMLYTTKPVVAVSMFAVYGLEWETASRTTRLALPNRRKKTVALRRGRTYVELLHHECATDGTYEVGECYNAGQTNPYGRDPVEMHRCNGPGGGHPDLLGWDVIEALKRLLPHRELASGRWS